MIIIITLLSRTICSSRRSINKWDVAYRAIVPELLRIFDVQFLMHCIIKFSCIGSCSYVKDEIDPRFMTEQPFKKNIAFYFFFEMLVLKVRMFLLRGKFVDKNKIIETLFIQVSDKTTADKACSACHNNRSIFIH